MTQPFFSIVIPTYNRSNLFPLAVRSLLKQTFPDFEIVISDNCSEDDTPQVARQFTDARVRYVRTPQHYVIADSWEFARRQATGKLIIMLSDDDAFVGTALERFAHEATRHEADFVFCAIAQYRDRSFPGPEKNSVECPGFSGSNRVMSADEFVRPLFQFQWAVQMHPSAFAFSKEIADFIAHRTGRFFWTNGVEFSAWPMTAVHAKNIVFIDIPLNILGRTAKSWGSNMGLCNPGKERIQAFIDDIDHTRKYAPLNNFTTCNLMAEGMLTAKSLFPTEFAAYEFDEAQYLRATVRELIRRRSLGVDVTAEMADATQHAARRDPSLLAEFERIEAQARPSATKVLMQGLRSVGASLGARKLKRRLRARQLAQNLESGNQRSSFWASGDHFGFNDILGCADFLDTCFRRTWTDADRGESTTVTTTVPRGQHSLGSTASMTPPLG
jgi:glycosyltransferase involved in cell wall biosynthesis